MQKTITTIALASILSVSLAGAQGTTTATTTSTTTQNARNICISNAVNKRDTAMIIAHDAFSSSIKSALTARKDSLVAGWATGNSEARKAAWNKFKTDTRAAHDKMRNDRKAAWNNFEADKKACGVAVKNNKKHNKWDDDNERPHKVENATYTY